MPRLGRRRTLSIAATVAALLAVPAAADAATYTIKPGDGACGAGDLACGGFVEAAAAAEAGDVFNAGAGVYPGATFTAPGITINGQSGVLVNSTLTFSGAGGEVSNVSRIAIVTAAAAGPAIVASASAGLQLSDAVAISQNDNAIYVLAGAANKIVRSIAATGGAATSAIRVKSDPGSDPQKLTVESTLASGGASAIGAFTQSALLFGPAGDITLVLRHVTAAGASNGVVLDSSAGANAANSGAGNITATLTDSIALNNAVARAVGVLGVGSNSVTLDTGTRNIVSGDPKTIFADPSGKDFRLRPSSSAIGQGGVEPGESATDIDGEDRSTAPTDLGGDEFNNAPPVAKIAIATATPRATQAVTFDGSGSTDREASYGGGIVQYQWTFSDGKSETTTAPTVSHVFPKEGDASARLIVVDRQGATSAPGSVALKLIDGTPPTVGIVKPKNNQKIKQFTTRTTTVKGKKRKSRTRTKLVFGGLSRDANGVAQIALTLEKLTTGSKKRTKCHWYDPKKGLVHKSCRKPVLFAAKLKKGSTTGEWTYTIKRNLGKGSYRLRAVGIDATGASGNAGGSKLGVVRFTLT